MVLLHLAAYLDLCNPLLPGNCSALFEHKNAGMILTDVLLPANDDPVTSLEGPNFSRMFGMVLIRFRYLFLACHMAR